MILHMKKNIGNYLFDNLDKVYFDNEKSCKIVGNYKVKIKLNGFV